MRPFEGRDRVGVVEKARVRAPNGRRRAGRSCDMVRGAGGVRW